MNDVRQHRVEYYKEGERPRFLGFHWVATAHEAKTLATWQDCPEDRDAQEFYDCLQVNSMRTA